MRTVHLPRFVRPETIDRAIRRGDPIDLDAVCLVCGVWGDYGKWATTYKGGRGCPACGSFNVERIGKQ